MEELFDIVDDDGIIIGQAKRGECHGDPKLIHRTTHVVVSSTDGRILLQKRSIRKDVQPGKWDTAVGGHLDLGEDYLSAALRETHEELGLEVHADDLTILADLKFRNEIESENTRVYRLVNDGPFSPDPNEIDEVRFWTRDELLNSNGQGIFTPNLEMELALLLAESTDGQPHANP